MRSYAMGDIHGHYEALLGAHALIAADRAAYPEAAGTCAPIIHLGDLIDRGPASNEVVEHLMRGQAEGAPWVVLRGNHDRLLEIFLRDPMALDPEAKSGLHWLHPRLGGGATLASYGLHAPSDRPVAQVHAEALVAIPEAHRRYLRDLPLYYERGGAIFAHAGIRPHVAMGVQNEDDLLWIRDGFLDFRGDFGALIVHGHTALDHATHYGNRLNLDSGAGYGRPLSVVVIEGGQVFLLTPEGRKPITVTPDAPIR